MNVNFVLVMKYVVVEIDGQKFMADQLILEWEAEMKEKEVVKVGRQYITSKNFLTRRMVGLTRVGESSLTIELVDLAATGNSERGNKP